jgi:DNA-binding transcriptional regulator YiaG
MPNIGAVLKQEIQRLSKRESKAQTESLRKASVVYRRQISAMRAQISALEKQVAALQRLVGKAKGPELAVAEESAARLIRASAIRAMRARLGLTAAEFAKLAGVSGQSVYNWEHEKTHPQGKQLAALLELKAIGRREARGRLDRGA